MDLFANLLATTDLRSFVLGLIDEVVALEDALAHEDDTVDKPAPDPEPGRERLRQHFERLCQ